MSYVSTEYGSIPILSALTVVGVLCGLLIIAPLKGGSEENVDRNAAVKPANLADLPDAELERLAAEVLSTLSKKSKLIDSDATVSRLAFRRELDARRRHLGRAGFALRRLAVELGGYRHLEPSLFFWAYKTC